MRLGEILLEYKRDITVQKLGDKIVATGKENKEVDGAPSNREENANYILEYIETRMDPTKKKIYIQWLVREYINRKFRLEDSPRVQTVLTQFEQAKSRLPNKDINQYQFHDLETKMDKIFNVDIESGVTAQAEGGTFPIVPNSKVLYNGPLGQLAIPETEEAAKILGKGTKWCTSAEKNNMFDEYSNDGPLYIWRDKSGDKYQFHFEEMQFMDARDRSLSPEQIRSLRAKSTIVNAVFKKAEAAILREPYSASEYARDVIGGRWPEAEAAILKDVGIAYQYALYVIKGRWPEAEPLIAKSPTSAQYALHIIKGRWPEAEPLIAKSPEAAAYYAEKVIKGRWPEAEPLIAKSPASAYCYAEKVIKGRWPEAESAIAQDPKSAYMYANSIIKGRWPEAEAAIAKSAEIGFQYAMYIIGGRFPEAEPVIAKDSNFAYQYAFTIIQGRWPEGEAAIKKNTTQWKEYKDEIG